MSNTKPKMKSPALTQKILTGMTTEMTTVRIRRFNAVERLFHLFLMLTFLIQAATGFSRLFFTTSWGKALGNAFGGYEASVNLHKSVGVVMMVGFVIHTVYLMTRVNWKNLPKSVFGPDSLVPNLDDARNLLQEIRWFFGFGSKPTFDRWTYWEKFDYWAVYWGLPLLAVTGLMLMVPLATARVLPGWALNIADGPVFMNCKTGRSMRSMRKTGTRPWQPTRHALALDGSIKFALQGKERSIMRIALEKDIRSYLDRPSSLESDQALNKATHLLEQARKTEPRGPRFSRLIAEMDSLITTARTPVSVTIESDGITEVAIYKVGRLGRFTSKAVELRPGTYTITGARSGYRDVRHTLSVRANDNTPEIGPVVK